MGRSFLTQSPAETAATGETIAASLGPGSIVLLFGDLGAGKTTLVRGLARGLGADPDEVSSPTFTLAQQYRGRITLHHLDLYRLDGHEVDDLGIEELLDGQDVVVIEWADRLPRPIVDAVEIWIDETGDEARRLTVIEPGEPRRHSRR